MTDRVAMFISKKLPQKLVYWCAIRVWVKATSGEYEKEEVSDLTFSEVLRRWNKHYE